MIVRKNYTALIKLVYDEIEDPSVGDATENEHLIPFNIEQALNKIGILKVKGCNKNYKVGVRVHLIREAKESP
jgi:hypothetical protein